MTIFDIANSRTNSFTLAPRPFLLFCSLFFLLTPSKVAPALFHALHPALSSPILASSSSSDSFTSQEENKLSALRVDLSTTAAQRGLSLSSSSSLSNSVKRPCSRAPSLSAAPILPARPASAADYTFTTCRMVKNSASSLSANKKFKSSARFYPSPAPSTRSVRCQKRWTICTQTLSTHDSFAQCVLCALLLVVNGNPPLVYTLLS